MNAAEMVRRQCPARTPLADFFNILLEPFPVLSVMLLLGGSDPILPFNARRIGIELPCDFFDILRFPTSDLDKRAGAHLIEGVREDRSDPAVEEAVAAKPAILMPDAIHPNVELPGWSMEDGIDGREG